ncbi:MAG: PEP-utilizing enzyme [Egibacteraceae bacterium]
MRPQPCVPARRGGPSTRRSLSHTASVAHKFGVPAVVATGQAIARIPDGPSTC